MALAFTFPGQGSQTVGMGKDLADAFPEAKAVFDEVDEALGEALSSIMWDGPEDTLTLTANAQPALMAVSLAVVAVLKAKGHTVAGSATYVAGHSLGEYSALAAAESLTIADTARLLRLRGMAMQEAVPVGQGAMAAILGLSVDQASQIAAEASQTGVCDVANDNATGQVVLSGAKEAVDKAIELAKAAGSKRAILLPVSAPFHCRMMQPAADKMAGALAETAIKAPSVPLVSNVLADAITDPDAIRTRLVEQVTGTVRWRESVEWLAGQGVSTLVELGSGKVLSGLVRRIDRSLVAIAVGGPGDIDGLIDTLSNR